MTTKESVEIKIPVIAVIGSNQSGKTTTVVDLVKELVKRGYKVGTAKHIPETDFTIDTKNKDTWRHGKAGAIVVSSVAPKEIAVIRKIETAKLGLGNILSFIDENEVDVIVIEGFKSLIKTEKSIPKIITAKTREEAVDIAKQFSNVLAVVGVFPFKGKIMGIPYINAKKSMDLEDVVQKIIPLIKIMHAFRQLPNLNCGDCGFQNCIGLAKAVADGKATLKNCYTLRGKGVKVQINGEKVPMNQFVQDMIRGALFGLISPLKKTQIKGNESVLVTIEKPRK
ncbi:MAG TPA: molybdopterin-guanine dinucleotide biosynthesis protein B [archaeon]|nr:molybdopterin-guanine dinucleotide biosynthesis protein B [archaeon]